MMPTGNLRLLDIAQIASVIAPVNLATGANSGDYIAMKDFHRVAMIVQAAAGTAANDLTITALQATDAAGTGSKALNFTRIDVKQGADVQAIGQFTEVTQAAANTYTEATNGEEELIYVVDFMPEDLDIANDFTHITIDIAQVGAAKVGSVVAVAFGPKFGQDPQLSVL